jgi:hypothetical protein
MANASPRLTASSTSAASIPARPNGSAHTGRLEGLVGIFEATPLVGESTEEARHVARHG